MMIEYIKFYETRAYNMPILLAYKTYIYTDRLHLTTINTLHTSEHTKMSHLQSLKRI